MLSLPRFLTALSAACLLLASCSKEDTPPAPHIRPEVADQTVMMFLAGNNNLLPNFVNNIRDAQRFVSANTLYDCRLLAFIQPRPNLAAVLELSYDYERGGCVIDTLRKWEDPTFCSADGERITEVLGYMTEQAPAKRYGLIMGSHGTGWVPAQYMVLSRRSPDADFWKKAEGAYETRWFGSDKERATDIPVLAASLRALRSEGVKLDYLIFDACFMASIETLYDLRHAFDYVVAAPCEIMAAGFPYDRAVPYLFADDGSTHDLAQVCREFYDFYQNDWDSVPNNEPSGCISLCATEQLDALADVVRRLYATAPRNYDRNTLQHYEGLLTHVFYDLGHFVTTAYADAALLDEFRERMQAAFPEECRLHTERFFSEYNQKMNDILPDAYWGVSTSEPSTRYREYLPETAWYKATH